MFTQQGRSAPDFKAFAAELQGRCESLRRSSTRQLEFFDPSHVARLRISKGRVVAINPCMRHTSLREGSDPVIDRLGFEYGLQQLLEGVLVRSPVSGGKETPIGDEIVASDDTTDLAPQSVVASRNREEAVRRSISLVGRITRVGGSQSAGSRPVPKNSLVCNAAIPNVQPNIGTSM